MKDQLVQYVNLLFAGAPDSEDIKQEILQNTLDRYDDLISEGKIPEAAYRLAISGIGDINEILNSSSGTDIAVSAEASEKPNPARRKTMQAVAIGLYIVCAIPLFLFQNELGLCLTLAIVAAATVLLILVGKDAHDRHKEKQEDNSPEAKLWRAIDAVVVVIYLIISLLTMAWHITWIIFPLAGAVKGLVRAIRDLMEAMKHEN